MKLIRDEIAANGGAIPFAKYMQLALYAPGLGYYSAGLQKFGTKGDFVTAPEISALFSRCLARQCCQVLQTLGGGSILEFGAGSGVMAADLLLELERQQKLPQNYMILEVSGELRVRQQETLKTRIPHLFSRVQWLDRLPERPFSGVILANEVLDAMPVHRFCVDDNGIQEFYVTSNNEEFNWQLGPPSDDRLREMVDQLSIQQIPDTYDSEINLLLPGWMKSVSECLERGLVLLIDYGFPRHEYYHPDRSMGTLMCHYQHRSHMDPLILPGLQDITAHVDFTAVAEAAVDCGLQVAGFTNQAGFLLGCGLVELAQGEVVEDALTQIKTSQEIQKLTSPAEMGELFKVIALTRDLGKIGLMGFSSWDQRGRL